MDYLIDTNICIYIMNQRPPEVIQRFKRLEVGQVGISSITVSELQYGVWKSQNPERNSRRLDEFLLPFEILPYDEAASGHYGRIRAHLERKGQAIGPLDLLIAAQALSRNLVLVTNNEKEFQRIEALKIENWVG
ncbi:MAG: type II toxin-antitoxin system VapC family toxin [Deltaproteobacteria bacterium]|nr:type II toxin-antitoxin system VapC family toxin [Deltaproteobacteria bacterium]